MKRFQQDKINTIVPTRKSILLIRIACFFLVFFSLPGWSQKYNADLPVKWGKVLPAEVNLTEYENEPEAPAVVLCDFGYIEISNRTFYTRHIRIKILKEEGLSFATVRIPYQAFNDYEKVQEIKAQSITPGKAGKVLKQRLKFKDIEYKQIDVYNNEMVFTIPGAKVGSIIEYSYEIASLDFVKLDDWVFQHKIPTLWSEIRFDVPEPFVYFMTYKNGPELDAREQLEFRKELNWLGSVRWKKARYKLVDKNFVLYRSPDNSYVVNVLNERRKKIVHKNLRSLPPDVPDQLAINYAPRISFHLFQSYGNLPHTFRSLLLNAQMDMEDYSPSQRIQRNEFIGYVHYYLPTWKSFNEDLMKDDDFGMRFRQQLDYMPVINTIIKSGLSDLKKADAIYEKIWSSIKWNGTYTFDAPRELKEILKTKVGTSGEINLLLSYMMQRAGLDAKPVLVKTKFSGRVEQVYPVHKQFNHTIVNVKINGNNYQYDLTAPQGSKFIIESVNDEGFIVDEKSYGWINLANPNQKAPVTPDVAL